MMKSVCNVTVVESHARKPLNRVPLKSFWNSAFDLQGLCRSIATAGGFAPRCRANAMNEGQLSSNRPLNPAGYQMKCPIPSEGNSSPAFQVVNPLTVPPHSFCQIFRPIVSFCAALRFDAAAACGTVGLPGEHAAKLKTAHTRNPMGFMHTK